MLLLDPLQVDSWWFKRTTHSPSQQKFQKARQLSQL